MTIDTENKVRLIREMLDEASKLLEEARVLSQDIDGSYYFEGGGYGMGGWVQSGAWLASAESC